MSHCSNRSKQTQLDRSVSNSRFDAARFFHLFASRFDSLYDGRRTFLMRWLDRQFRSDMFVRFALTFEVLGDLAGKTVLDLGCGSGVYTIEALKRGASRVIAVDPAEAMLDMLRRRLVGGGFERRCELVEAAFPGVELEPCEHVIVMGVMDYIEDPAAFLNALRPLVLRSAAISFPSIHWFRTPLRRIRYRLRNCPVSFYDLRRIRELCESAGFGRVELRKIPGQGMDYHVCALA